MKSRWRALVWLAGMMKVPFGMLGGMDAIAFETIGCDNPPVDTPHAAPWKPRMALLFMASRSDSPLEGRSRW